ncbi:hypothetical protein ACLKA6_001516 [Drosophila palustris]
MVKAAPNLQDMKGSVKTIRKSASGELILRMQRASDPETERLHSALSEVLSGKALVKTMQETVQVEVLDIDESTTAEEVLTALFASLECDIPVAATPALRKARWNPNSGLALASIASKLLESGSCYIAPSVSLTEYGAIIDDIAQDARGKASVIIAGDFNAWATEWGSKSTTPRGSTLLDTFASLQVCLLNTGTKSTFSKAGRESIIDVTFASPLLARGSEWCVSDIYTHSDHLAVLTTLAPSGCHSARAFIHESYKTESLDMDCLLSVVSGLSVRGDANSSAEAMADGISAACNASMAKVRRGGNRHRPVAWWNEEIAVARMECHAARRRCQRTRSSPLRDLYATVFKGKRRELKEAIKRSKARHFQELCDAADSQPFGAAYKLVMRKLCRQPMPTRPHQLSRIVHTLFPRQPHLEHTGSLILQDDEFVPTNSEEVLSTTAKHEQDPYCDHCGGDVIEDAEHSIFHCPLFTQERELAAGPNTPLTPGNLVATMIATEHGWAAISTMASIIMKELRRRERSRREHSQTSD